ncbi:MAG: ParA family protein [Treponema sp.]|nr:ParA family protein [Treponema sp.]
MGKIFVFVNQKGGVGKTTSAINIGAYMARLGKKVLLVDFDSQGNMTSGVGLTKDKPTIYELMIEEKTADECIKKTAVENLDVVTASIDLAGFSIELVEKVPDEKERMFFLKNALDPLRSRYDYILIDCPPSLGLLTVNGLVAADGVLIPMQCEYFAIEGLALLIESKNRIQETYNPNLKIEGVFFTMYDSRTRLSQAVVTEVKKYFSKELFNTIVPRNVRLSEAPSHGKPICLYDPTCIGAKSYEKLAEEVISRG